MYDSLKTQSERNGFIYKVLLNIDTTELAAVSAQKVTAKTAGSKTSAMCQELHRIWNEILHEMYDAVQYNKDVPLNKQSLSIIGLGHDRPVRVEPEHDRTYTYNVIEYDLLQLYPKLLIAANHANKLEATYRQFFDAYEAVNSIRQVARAMWTDEAVVIGRKAQLIINASYLYINSSHFGVLLNGTETNNVFVTLFNEQFSKLSRLDSCLILDIDYVVVNRKSHANDAIKMICSTNDIQYDKLKHKEFYLNTKRTRHIQACAASIK